RTPRFPYTTLFRSARGLELLALTGPGTGGGGGEVLLEVRRGPGVVGAEERDDLDRRELGARVQRLDGRVVPLLDLPLVDLGDDVGVEVQVVDAGQVVGDGDGAEHHRDVP